MKNEDVKKAAKILEEIEELSRYKDLLNHNKHSKNAHFKFVQHWGDLHDSEKVDISPLHNKVFIESLDKIIADLQTELDNL